MSFVMPFPSERICRLDEVPAERILFRICSMGPSLLRVKKAETSAQKRLGRATMRLMPIICLALRMTRCSRPTAGPALITKRCMPD